MLDRLFPGEFSKTLIENDFNRGYLVGACFVLGLLVLFVVGRLILMFVFRRRRCSQIVVSTPAGNLTISRNVIEGTARRVLRDIGELDVRRIRLYRKGKNYSLLLCCTFFDGGKSVPDIAEGIRNEIRDTLQNLFGIKTLRRIDFHVEEQGDSLPAPEVRPPSTEEDEEFHADSGI